MIANDGATDEDLASLLAACDEAMADGDLPDLGDATAISPDQSRLLKGIECVRMMRGVWKRQSTTINIVRPTAVAPRPETIGRFRVLRELGRGGFGVVYLAFDPRVGRPLALKVPRPDLSFTPELRERFQHEARAAGALDHPNVVSVYETDDADGVPYIASAYCPGPSLAAWLAKQTEFIPVRVAAELVAQLADGVAHAHEKGIVHRDMKPANILLMSAERGVRSGELRTEVNDSALLPKVADFGLAKSLLGTTDGELTMSGTILGTPNYLAPEQADPRSGPVGPGVDIYGIGAILYELLTRRPPFDSDSVLDTLRQVRTEEPIPPRRLRTQVPRDLETICLKCLAKEPRKRYATAAALGEDLRRFLAGEAVKARPVSGVERLLRWGRRNPRVAGLTAALVIVFMAGIAGIFWQWQRAEAEAERARLDRDAAVAAQRVAETERERAAAETTRARKAVERMTSAGWTIFLQKGQAEAGRKILDEAIAYHEGFVADRNAHATAVLDAARAWNHVGEMRRDLGQQARSVAAYRRSIELYDRLLVDSPTNQSYRAERAVHTRNLGHVYVRLNQLGEAVRSFESAAEAERSLLAEDPTNKRLRTQLANTLINLGDVLNTSDPDRAEALFIEALPLNRELLDEVPGNRPYRAELALTQEAYGQLLWEQDRSPRGEELARTAREGYRTLTIESPAVEFQWAYLSRTVGLLARIQGESGRLAEAELTFQDALNQTEQLRKDYPHSTWYAWQTVELLASLASVRRTGGQFAEAEAALRQALRAADREKTDFAEEAQARRPAIGRLHAELWLMLQSLKRTDEADALVKQREEARDAASLAAIARTMIDGPVAIGRDPTRAATLALKATIQDPAAADAWYVLGIVHYRAEKFAEAAAALDRAMSIKAPDTDRDGFYLAMARARNGAMEPARAAFADAEKRAHRRMLFIPELKSLRDEAAAIVRVK